MFTYNPKAEFEHVMKVIQSGHEEPANVYEDGLTSCSKLENECRKLAEENRFDWNNILKDAEKMMEENIGDILPALSSLSKFTGRNDPRINEHVKEDYLKSLECFVLTARGYIDPRLQYAKSKNH
ncbi:MAG: hypothetical protein PHU12_02785 [Candidatus Aenigmarchaeota archaeon]|nr:hypothetical protein [Candidatus Aenigmarchaeota archaeon]